MEQANVSENIDKRIGGVGVGTWAWGDKSIWGYGKGYSDADLREAFTTAVASGATFFDTAELYGFGKSERLLGEFVTGSNAPVAIATKYFPVPWRFGKRSVLSALRRSLERLNRPSVELYQVHWPFHILSIRAMMAALAEARALGLTKAIGVSNYNTHQMQKAFDALSPLNVSLRSNQVEFSLLHRAPEKNGLLRLCRELNVTLIAYSPLAMGMLTGKYSAGNLPTGFRRLRYGRLDFRQFGILLGLIRDIGEGHGRKSCGQVALNWILAKGAVPIPGAKNGRQAAENAGASGWSLTRAEVDALDEASAGMSNYR